MPKPVRFTDKFLEKYKIANSRDEIFDKGGQGLGIRIGPRAKTFFFIRRVKGEKTRFTLGQYPAMSLAIARSEAQRLLGRIQKKEDPRTDIRARRQEKAEEQENTFAHTASRFITEYCQGKKKPLRPNTIVLYKWALQGELTEKWAARPLADILDRDVIRVIDKLETARKFASARVFKTAASKFFNWAVSKKIIRTNPARDVALNSEPSDFERERFLPILELQTVLDAASGLGEPWHAYVSMLILCGQRREETARMKWTDLSLEGDAPVWRIPADNAKNRQAHTVQLSPEAAAILSALPRKREWVFSTFGNTKIGGFSRLKKLLDKAAPDLEPWRLHDLRRSVSTGLGNLGFAPHIIEAVLNHISGEKAGVSGLYNRSRYEADCRRALAAWAQAITAKPGAKVVQLRAKQAHELPT